MHTVQLQCDELGKSSLKAYGGMPINVCLQWPSVAHIELYLIVSLPSIGILLFFDDFLFQPLLEFQFNASKVTVGGLKLCP